MNNRQKHRKTGGKTDQIHFNRSAPGSDDCQIYTHLVT